MKKKLLLTGGAGFIGSYVAHFFQEKGYDVLILDNLSRGYREAVGSIPFVVGDISDRVLLRTLCREHKIDATLHFAAYTDVGESVMNPTIYYQNNVLATLTFWQVMLQHGVKHHLFSSSAAVYGAPDTTLNPGALIAESHVKRPLNPYGTTKWLGELILEDLCKQYQGSAVALRYFNAAGGDPKQRIKHFNEQASNLIPIVVRAIHYKKAITVFGNDYSTPDGSCIRDYIHIHDLATAHWMALESLLEKDQYSVYNLGISHGYSVFEVIQTAFRVLGQETEVIIGPRREGDPAILVADSTKAKHELLWKPQYPRLEEMIQHAWEARSCPVYL